MQLLECHITNFMGIRDVKVDLDAPLVVFLGDNASGKTSLLKALRVGIGAWLYAAPDRAVVTPTIAPSEMRHSIEQEGDERVFAKQGDVSIRMTGKVLGQEADWAVGRSKTKSARTRWKEARPLIDIASGCMDPTREGPNKVLPLLAYFGATRQHENSRRTSGKGPESRTMGYAKALDSTVNLNRLLSRWDRLDRHAATKSVLEALHDTLSDLIPGDGRVEYDSQLEQPIVRSSELGEQAFSALSDGFRNVLEIGMDLALRSIQLNPALGRDAIRMTPGVVLIDEVGQHLHPSWQTEVLGALRRAFPAVQFIVSTHSPLVALHAGDEAIVYRASSSESDGPHLEKIASVGESVDAAMRGPAFGPLVTWGPKWMAIAQERADLLSKIIGEPNEEQARRLRASANVMKELRGQIPTETEDIVRKLAMEFSLASSDDPEHETNLDALRERTRLALRDHP